MAGPFYRIYKTPEDLRTGPNKRYPVFYFNPIIFMPITFDSRYNRFVQQNRIEQNVLWVWQSKKRHDMSFMRGDRRACARAFPPFCLSPGRIYCNTDALMAATRYQIWQRSSQLWYRPLLYLLLFLSGWYSRGRDRCSFTPRNRKLRKSMLTESAKSTFHLVSNWAFRCARQQLKAHTKWSIASTVDNSINTNSCNLVFNFLFSEHPSSRFDLRFWSFPSFLGTIFPNHVNRVRMYIYLLIFLESSYETNSWQ